MRLQSWSREGGLELDLMPRSLGTVVDREVDTRARPGPLGRTRREMWPGRVVAERPGGGSALASGSLYCVSDLVMARRRISPWPSVVGVSYSDPIKSKWIWVGGKLTL